MQILTNLRWTMATALVVTLLSAAASAAPAATPKAHLYVSPGETFTVTLRATPSTGYAWRLAPPARQDRVVKAVASRLVRPAEARPGAPAVQVFEFKAVTEGEQVLRFGYGRAWEKQPGTPVASYEVKVTIGRRTNATTTSTEAIYMRAHSPFTVRLAANPTTGYQWKMAPVGTDPAVVALTGSTYVPSPAGKKVGSGGHQVFRFRAVGVGQTRVMMSYARSWEKDVQPARTHTVIVTVEK